MKKIAIIILLVLLGVWLLGPFALLQKSTSPWKHGYASPRQYYEKDGQNLKSTTQIIDDISYSFDDIGNVIQDENSGQWINASKYKLASGVELKSMWYKIDDNWYYFNAKGNAIKNSLIKMDGNRYALDRNGALRKVYFKAWGHNFGTRDNGAIIENGGFFSDKYMGEYFIARFRGHGMKVDPRTREFSGRPAVMWKGKFYDKDEPAFFFKKDFALSGETSYSKSEYGQAQKDGECINNVAEGAQIYLNNDATEQIFIYDKADNSFYGYVLNE